MKFLRSLGLLYIRRIAVAVEVTSVWWQITHALLW